MDHALKKILLQRLETTRLINHLDLILISHVQVNSVALNQRAVSLRVLLPTQLLLRVMMEKIIHSDWDHVQDLKVQEKILFQELETVYYLRVQKQLQPLIYIHAHVTDF